MFPYSAVANDIVLRGRREAISIPASAWYYDEFNGADNTTLVSRVPNRTFNGNNWLVPSGAFVTNNGRAEARFTGAQNAFANIITHTADVEIKVRCRLSSLGNISVAGILFRRIGNNDYWSTVLHLQDNAYRIVDVTGGVFNIVREIDLSTVGITLQAGVDYTMRLTLNGDLIFSSVEGIGSLNYESSVRNTETRHGIRAQGQVGSGAVVTFDNFTILPPPPAADVYITTQPTIKIVSQYETSVVHTENDEIVKLGNATARTRAWDNLRNKITHHHLYSVSGGLTQLWPVTGSVRPSLSEEPTNWSSMDFLMQIITGYGTIANVPGIGGIPCVTDQTYHGWLSGVVNSSGVTTPKDFDDSFSEEGRPLTDYLPHQKKLFRRILERYMREPDPGNPDPDKRHGCNLRHICLGIEFHGWFENAISGGGVGGGQANDYAWHDYPGTPGLNADMGYAYYHNEMGALIHQVATELGIPLEEIVIINNYPRMLHRTVPDSNSVASDHPLYDTVWGTADRRPLRCLSEGLPLINPDYLQAIAYDLGVRNDDHETNGPATDDITNLQKLYDYPTHIRDDILANLTTPLDHLPLIQRELYPRPQDHDVELENYTYGTMFAAESLRLLVEAGVWQGSHWGFRGRACGSAGGTPTLRSAMITSIATSDGGAALPVLNMIENFDSFFSDGTDIYDINVAGSGVSAIVQAEKALLINTTNTDKIVNFDNQTFTLSPYQTMLRDR